MAAKEDGTVLVLKRSRRIRPGTPRRRLCRVYTTFYCARDGKAFVSSVVATYDPIYYRSTNGVGTRLTPLRQMPKWCSLRCKQLARRSRQREATCARPGCLKVFKTRHPNKLYHSEQCRQMAYREARKAARPAPEPAFEYVIAPEAMEGVATGLGLYRERTKMLDAALRVVLEEADRERTKMLDAALRVVDEDAEEAHQRKRDELAAAV